jgi:hypothetical protein
MRVRAIGVGLGQQAEISALLMPRLGQKHKKPEFLSVLDGRKEM